MELRKDLEAATGLELPPMLAFDYPTPEALSGCIMSLCPPPPPPPLQSAVQAADTAHMRGPAGTAGIAGGPAADEAAAETGADWERVGGDRRRVIVLQQVPPYLSLHDPVACYTILYHHYVYFILCLRSVIIE